MYAGTECEFRPVPGLQFHESAEHQDPHVGLKVYMKVLMLAFGIGRMEKLIAAVGTEPNIGRPPGPDLTNGKV